MTTATELTFKKAGALGITAKRAAEIGAKGPQVNAPMEAIERSQEWWDEYKQRLLKQGEEYVRRQRKQRTNGGTEAGLRVGPYVAWDIMAISPLELTGSPMIYQPDKVVPGGQWVQISAIMWTNPFVDVSHGFAVPPNTQLGGRDYRVTLHQANLTTGGALAPLEYTGTFPTPVDSWLNFDFIFQAPNVAAPEVFEVNITADILDLGQPYAAFSTWHEDIDGEPPWFLSFPPEIPASLLQHDIPLRYMVFPM